MVSSEAMHAVRARQPDAHDKVNVLRKEWGYKGQRSVK